jgi:hypothetical protein
MSWPKLTSLILRRLWMSVCWLFDLLTCLTVGLLAFGFGVAWRLGARAGSGSIAGVFNISASPSVSMSLSYKGLRSSERMIENNAIFCRR